MTKQQLPPGSPLPSACFNCWSDETMAVEFTRGGASTVWAFQARCLACGCAAPREDSVVDAVLAWNRLAQATYTTLRRY